MESAFLSVLTTCGTNAAGHQTRIVGWAPRYVIDIRTLRNQERKLRPEDLHMYSFSISFATHSHLPIYPFHTHRSGVIGVDGDERRSYSRTAGQADGGKSDEKKLIKIKIIIMESAYAFVFRTALLTLRAAS